MKKLFIILLAAMAIADAKAELLDPSAALQRAMEEIPAGAARRAVRAQNFRQVKPEAISATESEIYLFAAPTSLMIVSAESEGKGLLGYAENYVEGAELPPSMICMLNLYAEEIRALRNGEVVAATAPAGSRADFSPIEPICKTTWNQDAPYNDGSPSLNGKKTYTGCVATAMAQVLKTFEYPEKCSGGTFSYKWQNGNKNLSMNFDNTTLRWSDMLDSYSGTTTAVQRASVSGLMKAVGYASQMNYGTEASGTQSLECVAGIIRNFDYDYSMKFLQRAWFELADWQKMVYDELAAGRPVYYDGQNLEENAGHAFVVDGYSSDGLFHVNWGWGGYLDGYFRLTALNPDGQQGIGGSGGGYSDGCSALFGMKPGRTLTLEQAPLVFAISGGDMVLSPTNTSLGRDVTVSFTNKGIFMNYMPFEVSGVYVGMKFISHTTGQVYYGEPSGPIDNLKPYYGYYSVGAKIKEGMPAGNYTVQLYVCRDGDDSTAYDVYADVTTEWRKTAVVKGNLIKFTDYVEVAIEQVENTDAPVEYFDLGGRRVNNPKSGIYIRRQGSNTQTVHIQ